MLFIELNSRMVINIWQILLLLIYLSSSYGEDYYDLLGVPKTADTREIRRAFKKLAVELHPDKNKDDPDAHDRFVTITKAYEVLKDEESRKKYDLHGEDGLNGKGQTQYHSWKYYSENFGIYDDDPEIITLSKNEFEQALESDDIWFINFYSPMCNHCHKIAPEWRAMARELEGVIRIGAVNCEDDWFLCSQEGINIIPWIMLYPEGRRYQGDYTADEMVNHVLDYLPIEIINLNENNYRELVKEYNTEPFLVFFCDKHENCPSWETRTKVAAILNNLVITCIVDCVKSSGLCKRLGFEDGTAYFEPAKVTKEHAHLVESSEAKEIANEVLSFLPEATELDSEAFQDMVTRLKLGDEASWLVYFYIGEARNNLELKKIPALLEGMKIGRVNCARERFLCQEMHIQKYPVFSVFKSGGGYEFHHGRETAHDVAKFARESGASANVRILTPKDFPQVIEDGSLWFVDFFAPWCPPCMKFLPEFRKASRIVDFVHFGTVDCTIHVTLCKQYNINSYPTTILYNNSKPNHFYGSHTMEEIVEFVQDMKNPPVLKLTYDLFYDSIWKKSLEEIWLVDFFAPWCGPCRQFAPVWREFAKSMKDLPMVRIAEVDCVEEQGLCQEQGVRSYPSVRLYSTNTYGVAQVSTYNEHLNAAGLKHWLFQFLPSDVELLTPQMFETILRSQEPWLVDFYAPWCGHCHSFAPEFEQVAQALKGRVKAGKIDCEAYYEFCQRAGVRAYPSVYLYEGTEHSSDMQSIRGIQIHSQVKSEILAHVNSIIEQQQHLDHDEL